MFVLLAILDEYLKTQEMVDTIEKLRERFKNIKPELPGLDKYYTLDEKTLKTRILTSKRYGLDTLGEYSTYRGLFDPVPNEPPQKLLRLQHNTKMILVKGLTGTGKAFWQRSLLLIGPDDTIESIIKEQCGLSKSVDLERLKSKCLVGIDGFNDFSTHRHVFNFITDQARNVLVTTSNINLPNDLEAEFDTVCRTQGFQENDAEEFISKFSSRNIRKSVLGHNVSVPSVFNLSDKRNPLLIIILCILEKNGQLKMENKSISLCEVYFRLLQFLCRTDFFEDFTKQIGKIAQQKLQCDNPQTQEDVPSDYFDTDILTSEKNNTLSFAHSPIEIFMGALHFVEDLAEIRLEDSPIPVFLVNPLFLYFCLALLSDQNFVTVPNKAASTQKLKVFALNKIDLAQLDFQDIASLYPALDITTSHLREDDLALDFFLDILKICKKTREIYMVPNLPILRILTSVDSTSSALRFIVLGNCKRVLLSEVTDVFTQQDLDVVIDDQAGKGLDQLLEFLETIKRSFSVYFLGSDRSKMRLELSDLQKSKSRKLYIRQEIGDCHIVAQNSIVPCSELNDLTVARTTSTYSRITLGKSVIDTLCPLGPDGRQNNLPNISHLTLAGNGKKDNLKNLFQCEWNSLKQLELHEIVLDKSIMMHFYTNILPKLTYLKLSGYDPQIKFSEPAKPMFNLRKMSLNGEQYGNSDFRQAVEMKPFPNLTHIELFGSYTSTEEFLSVLDSESLPSLCSLLFDRSSMSNFSAVKLLENKAVLQLNLRELKQFTFSDNLSALLGEGIHFPNLVKLGVINCKLKRYDVGCLAQASVEGIFPLLAELDVSQNNDVCVTQDLFDLECRWEKLTSLNVEGRNRSCI